MYGEAIAQPPVFSLWRGIPRHMRNLDTGEINDVLTRQGIGVLAMVDGEQPYAIPMSFGYDAEQVVLPM